MLRSALALVAFVWIAGCVTQSPLPYRDRKDAATYALECAYAYGAVSVEAEKAGRWNAANEADSRLGWFVEFANGLELSQRQLDLAEAAARERVLGLPLYELASSQGESCSDFYARWAKSGEASDAPPSPMPLLPHA
jgi:hypothetical protein